MPKSSREQINKENTEPLSDDQALALLAKDRPFPTWAKKIIDPKILKNLQDCSQLNVFHELDELSLTGHISAEEFLQYSLQVPEYQKVRQHLRKIQDSAILDIDNKSIPYYHKRSYQDNGQPQRNHETGFIRLLKGLDEIIESQSLPTSKPSLWNQCLREYKERLIQFVTLFSLGEIVHSGMENKNNMSTIHRTLSHFTRELQKLPSSNPAAIFWSRFDRIRHIVQNKEIMKKACIPDITEETTSSEKLEQVFKKIQDLAQYRKILPFTKKYKDKLSFQFSGDEKEEHFEKRMHSICKVTMTIHDSEVCHEIPLEIDTVKGEIFLEATYIELQKFLSTQQYLQIQGFIIIVLFDYLRKKQDDIEIEHTPSKETLLIGKTIVVREEIQYAINEEENKTSLQEKEPNKFIRKEYQQASTPQNEECESSEIQEEGETPITLRHLSNITGTKAIAAITSFVGEPVRIRGSHHIFRNNLNGKSSPLNNTRGKTVAPKTLKSCLTKLEIDFKVFLKRVGRGF